MIVYTVRFEFDGPATREQYVDFLRGGHVASVLAAGAMSAELSTMDDGSLEVRYRFASREAYQQYDGGPAGLLRAEGAQLFPPETAGVRATRSLGDLVSEAP